jgi:hypothetical protein
MKIIKYKYCTHINRGTEETPVWENMISPVEICCTAENLEANEAIAQKEAYNGEYTIEDDSVEVFAIPTQLDAMEAQLIYTAMMTDTLLEV